MIPHTARALLLAVLSLPEAVAAQNASRRSADDYACILSGACADAPASARVRRGRLPPGSTDYSAQGFRMVTTPPRADLRLTFASGSARLTPAAMAEVRTLATALRSSRLAGKRFRIEGHTDSLGKAAINLRLSQQRADVVAATLVGLGVPRGRLEAKGFGAARPQPGLPATAAANRRVEAVALP